VLSKALAATAGVAIACCAFATPGAHAQPSLGRVAPASACSAQSGVTVIVDFTHFGGNIERGCDPGAPATALDAMHTAGFAVAGTARYGDAFVCRIDGRPSPKHEACTDTPPASSSWAFYFARSTDRAWTYSAAGVLSYRPAAGTLIAFAFGNYAKPGVLPSGATVTTTTTTAPRRATVPPTSPPVTALVAPTATTAPAPFVVPPASPSASTPPTTKAPPHPPASTRPSPTTTTTGGPRIVDKTASPPAPPADDSGSPLPVIITVVLVAAIGAGAFALIRSRGRRTA
jgi:hypothetical protein